MKKIILIGNGFDLAHDMKTKHSDVFDFIKEEIIYHKYNAKPLQSYSEYIMMEDFGISNSEIIMKWYRNDKVDKYLELEYDYNSREMVLRRAGLSKLNYVSFMPIYLMRLLKKIGSLLKQPIMRPYLMMPYQALHRLIM